MANKRDIKKYVRHTCGAIAGECVLAMEIVPGVDVAKLGEALAKVADLQEATLHLVSFDFDKGVREFESPKAYNAARKAYFKGAYNKLLTEFDEHLNGIVSIMNAALPKKDK